MADGLGITLRLVDMLPTILLQLAFNMATPGLTGFVPEVYAAWPKSRTDLLDFSHMPPPKSEWNALSVLCEEIVKDVHGMTEEKAIPPTWLMSVANVSTIGVKAVVLQLHMHLNLQLCMHLALQLHTRLALWSDIVH